MKGHAVFVLAAGVGGLVAACETTVGPAPDPLIEEELANAYAEAHCGASACCESGGLTPREDCLAVVEAGITAEMEAARASGATFDEAGARVCVVAVQDAAQRCATLKELYSALSRECAKAYSNKPKALGELCQSSWECADSEGGFGLCGGPDDQPKRCYRNRSRDVGESCGANEEGVDECEDGSFCDELICKTRFGAGEECVVGQSHADTCLRGLVCERDGSGRCEEPVPPGSPSDDYERCELWEVADGVCVWTGAFVFRSACAELPREP